jgi:hypothetical protein
MLGKWKGFDSECCDFATHLPSSDNPINQRILTMFMGKKKINYEVANNGREAVDKWQTGGFHLILVSEEGPRLRNRNNAHLDTRLTLHFVPSLRRWISSCQ